MKVFSLNHKSRFEFWAAFTPEMVEKFTKGEEAEWLTVACEAMLGFSGKSYLEAEYDWFVSPDADPVAKMNLIGSFIGGCMKNNENNKKKNIGIMDMTDDVEDKTGLKKKNCVSDVVLRVTSEEVYGEVLQNIVYDKSIEQLDDMREYLMDVEGVDIYMFILNIISLQKGTDLIKKTAADRLKEIIKQYNLAELIKSVMATSGAIDYIENKVKCMTC